MNIFQKLGKYLETKKTRTLFAVRTIFASRSSLFRWTLAINIGTLALALLLTEPDQKQVMLTKQVQYFSQISIPTFLRSYLFGAYSKYYQVDTKQIELPLKDYKTFSAFFTRKINRKYPEQQANTLSSPCDGKILTFSEVTQDGCHLIKGQSYSLSQLVLSDSSKYVDGQIQNFLKQNLSNKLYQIVIYLAPGDYHRFHAPTDLTIIKQIAIPGKCDPVNEAAILSGRCKYEKNGRVSVFSRWKKGLLTMIMVGALNVSRIHITDQPSLQRGDQLGYFNLGSTIVLIVEAKGIKEWKIKKGEPIKYGEPLFEYQQ